MSTYTVPIGYNLRTIYSVQCTYLNVYVYLWNVAWENELEEMNILYRMFCLMWNVYFCFLISHWEKYNTGVLYLPWGLVYFSSYIRDIFKYFSKLIILYQKFNDTSLLWLTMYSYLKNPHHYPSSPSHRKP